MLQLGLGGRHTSSVEDRRPDPSVDTDNGECKIIPSHGVLSGNTLSDLLGAPHMKQQVQERKRDRRWLLHACEAPERPLAVILMYPLAFLDCYIGYEVHALVFAIVSAGPTRETESDRQVRGTRGARLGMTTRDTVLVDGRAIAGGCIAARETCYSSI